MQYVIPNKTSTHINSSVIPVVKEETNEEVMTYDKYFNIPPKEMFQYNTSANVAVAKILSIYDASVGTSDVEIKEVESFVGDIIYDGSTDAMQYTNIPDELIEKQKQAKEEFDKLEPIEKTKKILGTLAHIHPLSTEINIETVADQLSNYQFAPDMKVTVDDLVNPIYGMDYEPHPANV